MKSEDSLNRSKNIINKKKFCIILTIVLIAVIVLSVSIKTVYDNQVKNNDYEAAQENTKSNLLAGYIKEGTKVGGITGTYNVLDTSDATAKPEDITKGKTAYVNGVKITGTKEVPVVIDGVTIPKGFYYVGGTKNDGIVISDASADENKYSKENYEDQANIPADGLVGNQFVWVPVENFTEFKRYAGYSNGSVQSISSNSEPSQEGYRYQNELEEYNSMMSSVEKNKGFYVARFEMGNEGEKVVSKKGATVWNNITWGNSMTDIGTNGAVEKAKGMYTNKSTHAVTSTLIYGVQWDAIMVWIDSAYKTSSCNTSSSFVANSAEKGNYSRSIKKCGSSDEYRVKNIYYLAGNVEEWTLEAGSTNTRVARGGDYSYSAISLPASVRESITPNYTGDSIRFPHNFIFVMLYELKPLKM